MINWALLQKIWSGKTNMIIKKREIIELKMFVAKEKAKFSKLQTALIKIKAEKEFGILFVQNNWEAI